jgi:heme exporter protein C
VPRITLFAILAGVALIVGQWHIHFYAPMEVTMRHAQKIFYIHVPLAWWALASFFLVMAASIMVLATRKPRWDNFAGAAAEVGLLMAVLSLLSGSLWGRYAWGTWWMWDPRLTTTLIMCFIYAAYLTLRRLDMPAPKRQTAAAVLGIVAFLEVPLVFFSARLWKRTIHPSVFVGGESSGLAPGMLSTLLVNLLAFGLLWLCLVAVRNSQLQANSRLEFSRAALINKE